MNKKKEKERKSNIKKRRNSSVYNTKRIVATLLMSRFFFSLRGRKPLYIYTPAVTLFTIIAVAAAATGIKHTIVSASQVSLSRLSNRYFQGMNGSCSFFFLFFFFLDNALSEEVKIKVFYDDKTHAL